MKKSTVNSRGFSLVELMVTIAIIAILAAIVVPAYSNYILRAKFQDEIGKMDNYRKAIAIFIQESGVTSDEQFQTDIANVKDNYFGDDNVAVMSELKENNGRLLSHPVINGTTYQIAITPRINDSGTLINWECNITIQNGGTYSAPPSGAMPRGCNVASEDLNDDQDAYTAKYDAFVSTKDAAIHAISLLQKEAYDDAYDASMLDTATEGSLGSLKALWDAADDALEDNDKNVTDAEDIMVDEFGLSKGSLNTDYTNKKAELEDNDNGVPTLTSQLTALETARDDYSGEVTDQDYVDILNNISLKETAINTARAGQGLNQLTEYRNDIEDTGSAEYTAANTAVTNRQAEVDKLTTAKTNYDTGVAAAPGLSSNLTTTTTAFSNANTALETATYAQTKFTDPIAAANKTFTNAIVGNAEEGIEGLNNSSAYSGDHVEKKDIAGTIIDNN